MSNEVAEAEEVDEEDGDEDDVEDALPALRAAGGIVLHLEGGVEALGLRFEGFVGIRVVPVVDKRGVEGAHDQGAAGELGEGFGNGGKFRAEGVFGGDELREEAGVAGLAGADACVQAQCYRPLRGDVSPAVDVDATCCGWL